MIDIEQLRMEILRWRMRRHWRMVEAGGAACDARHFRFCPHDCRCGCHFASELSVATCPRCHGGGVNNRCLKKAFHLGRHRDQWGEKWKS